jgi:hypothetical protein
MIVKVDDKIPRSIYKVLSVVHCYNYSTWKLLAWWLYIQSGLSCRFNPMLVFHMCGVMRNIEACSST